MALGDGLRPTLRCRNWLRKWGRRSGSGAVEEMGFVMPGLSRVVVALVLALVWIVPSVAHADEWESLGRQKASPGIDRDVIKLNRNEGPYTAIKLKVTGNVVTLFNVKVVFADGSEQALPVSNLTIRPGEETLPL